MRPGKHGAGLQGVLLNRRNLRAVFLLLLTGGVALRCASVWRPIDYTTTSPWRESDLGMIARNFWRGEMNILYPQIDWRRDTPGYVESELPALPWLMAAGYCAFGYHEEIGRVLALIVSLATLWAFARLARRLLPPFEAAMALIFFTCNPILIDFATNIQPDPMMLLFVIGCVYFFTAWLEAERTRDLALCAVAGALAILLKLPAIYLGLLIAPLCLAKFGMGAIKNIRVWALGLTMLAPAILWYAHTHQFWLTYGNSLGISDESHWLSLRILSSPRVLLALLKTMLKTELTIILGVFGLLLALAGGLRAARRQPGILYWLAAAFIFYLVALRTTGHGWSFYYHALSIAPLCLLMGLGCSPQALLRLRWKPLGSWASLRRMAIQGAALLTVAVLVIQIFRRSDLIPPRPGEASLRARYTRRRAFCAAD